MTYYIQADGNDSNVGSVASFPKKTMEAGKEACCNVGDIVVNLDGSADRGRYQAFVKQEVGFLEIRFFEP
jgi:hypothetical protein